MNIKLSSSALICKITFYVYIYLIFVYYINYVFIYIYIERERERVYKTLVYTLIINYMLPYNLYKLINIVLCVTWG